MRRPPCAVSSPCGWGCRVAYHGGPSHDDVVRRCALKSPLLLGNNLTSMNASTLATVGNTALIRVNQVAAGPPPPSHTHTHAPTPHPQGNRTSAERAWLCGRAPLHPSVVRARVGCPGQGGAAALEHVGGPRVGWAAARFWHQQHERARRCTRPVQSRRGERRRPPPPLRTRKPVVTQT